MVYLVLITLIFFLLRLFIWMQGRHVAVDQYFWAQYRDVRRSNKGEVKLPQYLLDLRQWYFPLFGRFIALLPDSVFRNGSTLVLIMSFVRYGLILLWGNLFVGSVTIEVALAGAIVFLSSPITATHDNQLNGRIGGSFLFDCLLAVGFSASKTGSVFLLILMIGLVIILLFLHLLTLQTVIICSIGFLFLGQVNWVIALLIGGVLAFLMGFKKYGLAIWDINSFWFRNRHLLSTRQIENSPLYGHSPKAEGGLKSICFQAATLIGMCPWALLMILSGVPHWSAVCAILLFAAFCITYIPVCKCWGHGRNYTYFMMAPVTYGLIAMNPQPLSMLEGLFLGGAFGVVGLSFWQYLRWMKNQTNAKDVDLDAALNALIETHVDRICCIPFSMADQVAYRSKRTVFWGGHGYGFRWIEPYFPVFKHPLERAVSEWNLGGVLLQKSYWPKFSEQVDQSVFNILLENEKYIFLKVNDWQPGTRVPDWARDAYPAMKELLPKDVAE